MTWCTWKSKSTGVATAIKQAWHTFPAENKYSQKEYIKVIVSNNNVGFET